MAVTADAVAVVAVKINDLRAENNRVRISRKAINTEEEQLC